MILLLNTFIRYNVKAKRVGARVYQFNEDAAAGQSTNTYTVFFTSGSIIRTRWATVWGSLLGLKVFRSRTKERKKERALGQLQEELIVVPKSEF